MSRSYRVLFAALVGLAVSLITAVGWLANPVNAEGQSQSRQDKSHTEQRRLNNPRLYEPDCEGPGSNEEADLCAQREMAVAARDLYAISVLQFWVSLFGLGALYVTIRLTRKAIDTATEANEITRQSAVRANRPWIRSTLEIDGPLEMSEHGIGISVNVLNENIGNTPAVYCHTNVGMAFSLDQIETVVDELSDKGAALEDGRLYGLTVVPGDSYTRPWYAAGDWPSINQIKSCPRIGTIVVACVSYQSPGGGQLHQTTIVNLVGRQVDEHGYVGGIDLNTFEDIPKAELNINKWAGGNAT